MSFTVDIPIVLTPTQTFHIDEIHQTGGASGQWKVVVSFVILDASGKLVSTHQWSGDGQAYNAWWASYSDGTVLYQNLAKAQGFPIPADGSQEADFVNNS